MFFEIALAAGAIYIYRRNKWRTSSIVWPWDRTPSQRADARGVAGERQSQAKLRETLNWLCGTNYYLHEGPLIIKHAPGSAFPTAEIDHLAVTPFGIFIFETKNWSGHIAPSAAAGMLTRVASSGHAEDRRSPLEQNRTKLAFLQSRLPAMWPVAGAGLFPSSEARLDPGLHSDLLSLADLPQRLRTRRDLFGAMPAVDVSKAVAAGSYVFRLFGTSAIRPQEARDHVIVTRFWLNQFWTLGTFFQSFSKHFEIETVKRLLANVCSVHLTTQSSERGGEKRAFRGVRADW